MAKKLSEIAKRVESSEILFYNYLFAHLNEQVRYLIISLSEQTEVYIFSGIIRNFFLNTSSNRDIDIVLEREVELETIFANCVIKKNSFGGYKIFVEDITLDIWFLQNTWALKTQPVLNFELEKYIPSTAFFNFSSIVFSLNKKEFYFTKHFLRFLRDKKLDVVYKPNANYSLCIVNTFYYSEKFNLRISDSLKHYIYDLYKKIGTNYQEIQIKHFGSILYSDEDISMKISSLNQ
ncbi:MAG TPA: hypothetical protein VN726_21265 [Hanamia sp.]|nr:hypothetical protein [Hanamia sp.]